MKSPLFFIEPLLSYKLFGIEEWSYRFPNALVAFLCTINLYFSGIRLFDGTTALASTLILISPFGFLFMARIITTDTLFTLWLFLSLLFFEYYREKSGLHLNLFYLSMGAATLSKGITNLVFIGLTLLIFLYTERESIF